AIDQAIVVGVAIFEVGHAILIGVDRGVGSEWCAGLVGVGHAVSVGVEIAVVGEEVAIGVHHPLRQIGNGVAVGVDVEIVRGAVVIGVRRGVEMGGRPQLSLGGHLVAVGDEVAVVVRIHVVRAPVVVGVGGVERIEAGLFGVGHRVVGRAIGVEILEVGFF